jgi:protein-tyrosine phosphatase
MHSKSASRRITGSSRQDANRAAIIVGVSTWFRTYGFAEVLGDLLVGAYPLDEKDVSTLSVMGVKRILNLVEDGEYRRGERETVERALASAGIEEQRLSLTDFGGLPAPELEAAVQAVNRWLDEGARTYVHCRAGWQRSAAVAAGVIAIRAGIGIDEALAHVHARKPSADPLPHQREDLRRWWQERQTKEHNTGERTG